MKEISEFPNEVKEHEFWLDADSNEYIDWNKAKPVKMSVWLTSVSEREMIEINKQFGSPKLYYNDEYEDITDLFVK